jgi:AMP deaminase
MEPNEEAKSSTPVGIYAGRSRSISIVETEELADHAPRQPLATGRGTEAFQQQQQQPPAPPPLHHSTNADTNANGGAALGVPSLSKAAMGAPRPPPLSSGGGGGGNNNNNARLEETNPFPGSDNSSSSSSSTAGGNFGGLYAHPLSPASDRSSIFRTPSYRTASGTSQATLNNNNDSFGGHALASLPGPGSVPTSWRRAFSQAGTASNVSYMGSSSNNNSNAIGGGGGGGGGGTVTGSRQQRPPSLLYRHPSFATTGIYGHGRNGGGPNFNSSITNTTTTTGLANVYTLQLTEDDGGVEMAAARPLLVEALRLRDTYKGVDKGQMELGGNNNNGMSSVVGSPLNTASAFGGPVAPAMSGLTALQQVDGVLYWTDEKTPIVPWVQFTSDVMAVATCVQNTSCLSVAKYRLQVLEEKYHLHRLYNADVEENGDRYRRGGGLYANACRVDNCVGVSTAMNAHWLVEYIQQTVDAHGGDVVESAEVHVLAGGGGVSGRGGGGGATSGGGGVGSSLSGNGSMGGGDAHTLERVCELLDFPDPYLLTVEGLGLQPSVSRALPYYDALDPALNGSGRSSAALLRLFLSLRSSSPQRGDYLAGAVQPSLNRNELRTSCPQATEMTLDITGMLAQEWEQTATWVRVHELDSYRTNQFQIAFPVTKWCSGDGRGGSDGGRLPPPPTTAIAPSTSSPYRGRAAAGGGGLHDTYEDLLSGTSLAGNGESQGMHRTSMSHGNVRSAASGGMNCRNNNYSTASSDADDAAVPLDAAPEDVLTYENYQQLLDHLFLPLFMATLAPEDPKFVDLASLLQHTGAILLTGDETAKTCGAPGGGGGGVSGGATTNNNNITSSGCDGRGRDGAGGGAALLDGTDLADLSGRRRRPADVPYTEPVSLTYMCYHIWANLCSLNALRRRRGLNVLQLRVVASNAMISNTSSPHDANLLLLSYLIADVVVDAVALDKQPALQYLYGMKQVGVTMCPMARSSLGTTPMSDHPLAALLWRGLRVSLCTISPLYYHASQEPLLEEYAAAAKSHRLSPTDISELSLHSVCMSAFDDEVKASWVGAAFLRDGWRGNAVELTSVPTARLQLRHDAWAVEWKLLTGSTPAPSPSTTPRAQADAAVVAVGSRPGKRGSTAPAATTFSPTRTGSAAATAAVGGGVGHASNHVVAAATVPPQPSPYTVLDPAVSFPRLFVVGPYDRDIANAHIAQSLHRALDLRHQYSALPLAQPSTLPPSEAAIEAVAGADGSKEDVRNTWLASLIHDPQAVLPHPTQSMSWAFKKMPLAPAAGTIRTASPGTGRGATGSTAVAVAAGAAAHPQLHFDEDEWKYKTVEGIIVPHEVHQIPRLPQDMYHYEDFCRHVQEIRHLVDHIRVREFALRRLQLLEHRFNLHAAVNHSLELGSTAERASQNRDFYQSTKVDNNIRMETGITARQLLAFIVDKATHNGDDIVSHPKGKEPQTLRQLLSELHISPHSLTVDDLNIQAGATSSDGGAPHNPFASEGTQDELLTLLLKTDNQMNGRYFAELTKRTFEELSRDQHTFTESRLPIYGASAGEWGLLSHWFDTHGMASSHNQWVVQVPRIYSSLRKAGRVASFAEYLEHIFEPLWRISLHPNSDPRLFHFVNHIAAFDCVEDERRPDMPLHRATCAPHEWTSEAEPPFNYYLYHLYANLRSLNRFRQRRRFSVFAFRPSCGEAGNIDHLIGSFLLAQSINYGVRLADSAPLQYLFYLAQIGVTLSPLSNNTKLDLNYLHNPFPQFFRRGLRVSLGTDSPLLYHHTQEPLLEEYSIASKIWKLSPNDLSEVARNSVLLSNFSLRFKEEKLGPLYFLSSSAGNDVTRTHLSDVRVAYRFETYHTEVGFLEYISGQHFHKALLTLEMETQCKQLCGVMDKISDSVDHDVEAAAGELMKAGGPSTGRGPANHSPSPFPSHTHHVLIDPTPKEADVKQLEQQRARMQRQLHELTNAVADLHKQNRLLTAKLGEEKERDQQAAYLRRHRVGDKLRELQVLLEQKQVQPAHTSMPTLSDGGASTDDITPLPAVATAEPNASSRSASLLPFAPATTSFGANTSQTLSGGAAKSSPTSRGGNGGGQSTLTGAAEGEFFAAAPSSSCSNSAPRAPALSSRDVFSTVRNRKVGQREATVAQTRQLLAHSELLWRSPALAPSSSSASSTQQEAPSGGVSRQGGGGALPPLETSLALPRKRWSPSPSLQD